MIGIIAASEDELQPILNNMKIEKIVEKAMLKFNIGLLFSKPVVAVFSGVCKVNAAIAIQLLISEFSPTHIFVTGVAGALDKSLKIGDTIIAKQVAHHDVNQIVLTEYHPYMKSMWYNLEQYISYKHVTQDIFFENLLTGESFIKPEHKKDIIGKFSAKCVDMESAAYAQVCYAYKVPLVIFKTITDNTDENGHSNFEKYVNECSKKCASFVTNYIIESMQ